MQLISQRVLIPVVSKYSKHWCRWLIGQKTLVWGANVLGWDVQKLIDANPGERVSQFFLSFPFNSIPELVDTKPGLA